MSGDVIARKPRGMGALTGLAVLAAAMAAPAPTNYEMTNDAPQKRGPSIRPKSRRYAPKVASSPHDHACLTKAEAKRARKRQRNLNGQSVKVIQGGKT